MKTLVAILICAVATVGLATEPRIEDVTIFTGTWLITFEPNGRASAQYGSTPGDSGFVEPGTIDFNQLIAAITKAEKKGKKDPADRFQIAVRHEGQTSIMSFTVKDEAVIEQMLATLDAKWKQHPVGKRFDELKRRYPIIPKK